MSTHFVRDRDMKATKNTRRLTLNDVITTVSRLARNEHEAAAVINHLLSSSKITFSNPMRGDLKQILV
jgi:hypothetical protein